MRGAPPKPPGHREQPCQGLTLKYDAWNRLVEVKEGDNVIAWHEYDGLNRQMIEARTFAPTTHYMHKLWNSSWQVLELRSCTTANTQPESLGVSFQYLRYYRTLFYDYRRRLKTLGDAFSRSRCRDCSSHGGSRARRSAEVRSSTCCHLLPRQQSAVFLRLRSRGAARARTVRLPSEWQTARTAGGARLHERRQRPR